MAQAQKRLWFRKGIRARAEKKGIVRHAICAFAQFAQLSQIASYFAKRLPLGKTTSTEQFVCWKSPLESQTTNYHQKRGTKKYLCEVWSLIQL